MAWRCGYTAKVEAEEDLDGVLGRCQTQATTETRRHGDRDDAWKKRVFVLSCFLCFCVLRSPHFRFLSCFTVSYMKLLFFSFVYSFLRWTKRSCLPPVCLPSPLLFISLIDYTPSVLQPSNNSRYFLHHITPSLLWQRLYMSTHSFFLPPPTLNPSTPPVYSQTKISKKFGTTPPLHF